MIINEINCPNDYEDWATNVLSEFTEELKDDKRYCLPINEQTLFDRGEIDDTWSYIFTQKGQSLVHRWTERLYRLGHNLFPDVEDFDIQNWHYKEC